MKVRINKEKFNGNGKNIDDLFSKIFIVFGILIICMFVVLPLATSMNVMYYLRSRDFIISTVSLVMLFMFYKLLFGFTRPKRKTRKQQPQVYFKPQEQQQQQPQQQQQEQYQQPFQPPDKIQLFECEICKHTILQHEIVEITNNVFICKQCLKKSLGEENGKNR